MPFPPEAIEANRVTEVTRRNIVDTLLLRDEDYHGRLDEVSFLGRIWNLTNIPSTDRREPHLEADLRRHIAWGDDGYDEAGILYGKLGVLRRPDEQFGKLLAECLHPLVRADARNVAELLAMFNKYLAKDGFVLVETSRISGHPVYEITEVGSPVALQAQDYDVSLSFAGEQREYVDAVAHVLRDNGVTFFYAPFEEANLWGEDLTERFDAVFLHGSRFVAMFLSEDYANKMWPTYERRAAVERAMAQHGAYILPVRFDDCEVPGIRKTVFYADARKKQPEEIARLILEKLGRAGH